MDGAMNVFRRKYLQPLQKFAKESRAFATKCTKPTEREYFQLLSATGTGFAMVGFFGFFIRLIFIPIVRILCH
eukprot:m.125687 g.125687  ORF g.125687 m.125687 type:complete len:73 (+) comp22145_c1_seq1:1798-2016(+)